MIFMAWLPSGSLKGPKVLTVSKAPVVFKVYPVLMALLDPKVYQEMLAPKDPLVLMAPRVFKVFKVLLVLVLTSAGR